MSELSRVIEVYYARDDDGYPNEDKVNVTLTVKDQRVAVSYEMPQIKMWQYKIFQRRLAEVVKKFGDEKGLQE